jgi:hypothetical protein
VLQRVQYLTNDYNGKEDLVLILFLLELFGEMNTKKISTKHGTKKFSLRLVVLKQNKPTP